MKERDIDPSYGMGQNFMTDASVASWIVDQLDLRPDESVMEIGPGMGALTEHLVKKSARHFYLVEKDDKLAGLMREKFGHLPNITIIHGDAVRLDMRPWFKEQPLKVLGALPYSCGTEIIRNLLHNPSPVRRAVFTLQKEVCVKLSARPNDSLYGLLSLRQQARWCVEFLRQLPPHIFLPRPAVDSGVISMEPRPRAELPVFDEAVLDRVMAAGFSQRRKMLRNLLPDHPDRSWMEIAGVIGATETARAQELTLQQWIGIANIYDTHTLKDNPQKGDEIFDVVNERNEVVRQELRRTVHAEGLCHRAVHIFVINAVGDVFLQKRSHLKDSQPEKWDSSASGHLDSGENYRKSAVRELEEELGIQVTVDQLTPAGTVTAGPGTGWEFVELFTARWSGRPHWPASEIETGQWFPPTEIDAWTAARPEDFADGFLECWRLWRTDSPQNR